MNRELEAILQAYEAAREASGRESKRLYAIYESRLDDVLARQPSLTRERLEQAILRQYQRWVKAQEKPSSPPPKA